MDFIQLITKIFGNKSTRDMKAIQPLVEEVKAIYPKIEALDNDALRARAQELKAQVQAAGAEQKKTDCRTEGEGGGTSAGGALRLLC
jgi:preprotein translocase subunit SecA